ncbi:MULTISPECIES: hypothetical protein [unclassified Rhizobium]|uniref:hypothetical protein n=1 Tax=unclassified Rhizobium TaxID=2613769 RepID=UPI00131A4F97|nr:MULTISPECIES: hypothetical protein [Rhizobium]UWU21383.1 hypothetical protein N2601_19480 [Rhizobium tropici]
MARFPFGKRKTTTRKRLFREREPEAPRYRQPINAKKGRAKRPFHEFWPVTGLKQNASGRLDQSEDCLAALTTISMPDTRTEISLDIGSPSFRYVDDMPNVTQILLNSRVQKARGFTLRVALKRKASFNFCVILIAAVGSESSACPCQRAGSRGRWATSTVAIGLAVNKEVSYVVPLSITFRIRKTRTSWQLEVRVAF